MEPLAWRQRYSVVSAPGQGQSAREKGKFMSLAERVTAHLPYLRRFARAVTGSQKSGDAYVASTLEAILADPSVFSKTLPPRVALYRTVLKILGSRKWTKKKHGHTPP